MSNNIQELTQEQQQKLVTSFAEKLNQDLRNVESDLRVLASLPSISDFLMNRQYLLEQESKAALQDSYQFMQNIYQRASQYHRISICDANNQVIANFVDGLAEQYVNQQQRCLENTTQEQVIQPKPVNGEYRIIATQQIINRSILIGVVEISYSLTDYLQYLQQHINFKSGYFSLFDKNGKPINTTAAMNTQSGSGDVLTFSARINKIDWTLKSIVYANEIFSELNKTLLSISLFVVLTIILEVLLIVFFTKKIVLTPLQQILNATKQLKSGEKYSQVTLSSKDEFGELAASFNSMASSLSDYINQLENKKRTVEESEEKLQSILDNSPSVVYIKSAHSVFQLVNKEFLKLFQMEMSDVIGKSNHQLFSQEIADAFTENDMQVVQSGQATKFEELAPLPSGEIRHYLSVKFPLFDLNGNVSSICGISTDITEMIESEQQLIKANQQFELIHTIFMTSREGMLIMDSDFKILDSNPAFEQIFGYSLDEIKGKDPEFMRSNVHDEDFYRDIRKKLLEAGHWQGELWERGKNGDVFPQLTTLTRIQNKHGEVTNYAALFSDISDLKQTQEKLHHLAHYDVLTGLANRVLLKERLDDLVKQSKRVKGRFATFFLDLDNFKFINDSLGHSIGDKLILQVGQRLHGIVRETDMVARLGGDEFILLIANLEKSEDVSHVATKIQQKLAEPFQLADRELYITSSIGISIFPDDAQDTDALMRNADTAMYSAKNKGKNIFQFYSDELNKNVLRRLQYETDLHQAIQQDGFHLNYQPMFNPADNTIVKMESLIRWQNQGRDISPVEFIPVAEESGLIIQIGDWVLEHSCRTLKRFHQNGYTDLKASVNLSVIQFHDVNLAKRLSDIVDRHELDHSKIEFEITESVLIDDYAGAQQTLKNIQQQGFGLVLDDFGTGFSSLGYLKRLPFNALKLDRLFVQDILKSHTDQEIIKAIIAMAQALKMEVVCEGIETQEQLDMILSLGHVIVQGYYYSKPVTEEEFAKLLTNRVNE